MTYRIGAAINEVKYNDFGGWGHDFSMVGSIENPLNGTAVHITNRMTVKYPSNQEVISSLAILKSATKASGVITVSSNSPSQVV